MSIAARTALARFGRVFLFGGVATLIGYLAGAPRELGSLGVGDFLLPLVTAVLAFADKWAREQLKANTTP